VTRSNDDAVEIHVVPAALCIQSSVAAQIHPNNSARSACAALANPNAQ